MTAVDPKKSYSERFAELGYYLYAPARFAGHCVEKMTRPSDKWNVLSRVAHLGGAVICSCLAIPAFFIATPSLLMSRYLQESSIIVRTNDQAPQSIIDEKLRILFLNSSCQSDPFAALTAGMPSSFEPFSKNHPSRQSALAEFCDSTQANVLCFSEAHDYGSSEKLQKFLEKKGYVHVAKHIPNHPIWVNSGLLAVSKKPLQNVKFIEYPREIRSGVHYGAEQGCIVFDVQAAGKTITVASTHLNFGFQEKHQQSRVEELKCVFRKLVPNRITILGGDFNFPFMKSKEVATLAGDLKAVSLLPEDTETTRVTFEKGGHIRGKKIPAEVVDGAFVIEGDSEEWEARVVDPKIGDAYVTDHYGLLVEQI